MSGALAVLTIYGASDDLIEVEGAIRDEFPVEVLDDESTVFVAVAGGIVLSITYSQTGVWRIDLVHQALLGSHVDIARAPEGNDRNYSDRATIELPPLVRPWVLVGSHFVASPWGQRHG